MHRVVSHATIQIMFYMHVRLMLDTGTREFLVLRISKLTITLYTKDVVTYSRIVVAMRVTCFHVFIIDFPEPVSSFYDSHVSRDNVISAHVGRTFLLEVLINLKRLLRSRYSGRLPVTYVSPWHTMLCNSRRHEKHGLIVSPVTSLPPLRVKYLWVALWTEIILLVLWRNYRSYRCGV